jgi:hypothetical protein
MVLEIVWMAIALFGIAKALMKHRVDTGAAE